MDVLEKLKKIMDTKKLSVYKLSKISGVPQSTINSLFRKNNNPTIDTLERICKGLNMSLNEFFSDDVNSSTEEGVIDLYRMTKEVIPSSGDDDLETVLIIWQDLTTEQKKITVEIVTQFKGKH